MLLAAISASLAEADSGGHIAGTDCMEQIVGEPAVSSDAKYVENDRVDGGTLSVSGETFEYLLAEFGRPFRGIERKVVDVGDGCLPTKEDLAGAIAIARRGGGCQFLEKAWRAQEAGAAEVLISNRDATDALVRAGCHPRWTARKRSRRRRKRPPPPRRRRTS